ncbi:MAG: hypothetical protein LAT79_18530, partial [Kiritimatiellae bacterium]|nr:hypothetical protein [Kiritimatiellia bacterium]
SGRFRLSEKQLLFFPSIGKRPTTDISRKTRWKKTTDALRQGGGKTTDKRPRMLADFGTSSFGASYWRFIPV